jgi:FlaA1/EpsC-like NDP-sugar epimerase
MPTPLLARLALAVVYWAATVCAAMCGAFLLRFDFRIPPADVVQFKHGLIVAVAVKLPVFISMRLHREHWSTLPGMSDLMRVVKANTVASTAFTAATLIVVGGDFSRSVYCLDFALCVALHAGARFATRVWTELRTARSSHGARGLIVYGAGVAGIALAREIRANAKLGYRTVGFLDDDPRKQGATLMGVPVLGTGADAARVVAARRHTADAVHDIAVTMPSASGRQIRTALTRARAANVPCRIVPGLGELISRKSATGDAKQISVTDLLDREPVKLDLREAYGQFAGWSILVTGAAGSIGTELCHQLAKAQPRCLVALDQAESELFRLENDLRAKFPGLHLEPELADIRDAARLDQILDRYAVNAIFHAAAYKHVPMVERYVCEGITTNVLGTWKLAQAACRHAVSTFVMISTDKAVNPTSVMGLTKRVAELIVTAKRTPAPGRGTRFVCLRFGNVLVSNGSVVPIFEKQIAAGGPVTVTHPRIRRFFMTVHEAVQIVLHASTMGRGSDIFVLDMGQPVHIADLARKMITLAGFTPDVDIEIRYVGLRPGEKLYEELQQATENLLPTTHERIMAFAGAQLSMEVLVPWIAELQHLVARKDGDAAREHLKRLVPEYQESVDVDTESAAAVDAAAVLALDAPVAAPVAAAY